MELVSKVWMPWYETSTQQLQHSISTHGSISSHHIHRRWVEASVVVATTGCISCCILSPSILLSVSVCGSGRGRCCRGCHFLHTCDQSPQSSLCSPQRELSASSEHGSPVCPGPHVPVSLCPTPDARQFLKITMNDEQVYFILAHFKEDLSILPWVVICWLINWWPLMPNWDQWGLANMGWSGPISFSLSLSLLLLTPELAGDRFPS